MQFADMCVDGWNKYKTNRDNDNDYADQCAKFTTNRINHIDNNNNNNNECVIL